MREGPGYFLFESRRPFKHVTCVPRARPQHGQHASPAGRSHRRPRRRQGGKGWQGRRQGRWQGLWPCGAPDPLCAAALNARYSVEPAERRRQSCGRRRPHTASSAVETAPRAAARCATTAAARLVAMDAPDPLCAAALNARYSVRAGGATAAELRPLATSHGVERRRDGPESRRQVCHDRGREARGDGCARPALRRRPQRPILDQSRRSDGGGVAAAGDLPLDHAADPSTSTCGLPSRRRRRRAAHPEPAGAAGAGPGAGGRAGTRPAEATMPLAALQAARGAPLAGLPHAPEGREGREAGLVTRGHGRCGPRRARARDSP